MKYNKNNGEQQLTVVQQFAAMKRVFPEFTIQWKKSSIVFIGPIQPTAMSEIYTVQIACSAKGNVSSPTVRVLNPKLNKGPNGEDVPHLYPNKSLCLYLPLSGEFTSSKYVAETLVPWVSLWLYYYEQWQITGKWLGGGVHPGGAKTE